MNAKKEFPELFQDEQNALDRVIDSELIYTQILVCETAVERTSTEIKLPKMPTTR